MIKLINLLVALLILNGPLISIDNGLIYQMQEVKGNKIDSIKIRSLYWNVRTRSQITPERFWKTKFRKSEEDFFDTTVISRVIIDSIESAILKLERYSINAENHSQLLRIDTRLSIQLFYHHHPYADTVSFGTGGRYLLLKVPYGIVWNSTPYYWKEGLIDKIIQVLPDNHKRKIPVNRD